MKTLLALPLLPFVLAFCACVACGETSPAPKATDTGIEGVMTISPIKGGPIRQGEQNSKPLPATPFIVRQGGSEVASFETDAAGHFRVSLPPGKYDVVARDNQHKFGGWGPFPVEVTAGKMTTVTWDCDSGLR
ncbi:MAG: carboxypeptidase-like regulatory domain-containing protein [Chthoniobacterales bacterium]